MRLTKGDFQRELEAVFREAERDGRTAVTVTAGDLHRRVGSYPAANHRMPVCCDVLYESRRAGDVVLAAPPKGKGASLAVRYRLPR